MKPIATTYKGHRFRSRLEARWAVFFDTTGIKWDYEAQGYELEDGSLYLPDFWISEQNCWVEIKGTRPRYDDDSGWEDDFVKAILLARSSKKRVYYLSGNIPSLRHLTQRARERQHFEPDIDKWLLISDQPHTRYEINPSRYSDHRHDFECEITPCWSEENEWLYNKKGLDAARAARFEHGESGSLSFI